VSDRRGELQRVRCVTADLRWAIEPCLPVQSGWVRAYWPPSADNEISGGKVLSVGTRKVNCLPLCGMAAQSLHHSKTALGDFYRRMRAKLGAPRVEFLRSSTQQSTAGRAAPPRSIQFRRAVLLNLGLAPNRIAFRGAEPQGI
jgi:hypothetical protein